MLVRHSYDAPERWMLPGGGLGRGECVEAAAARELREETGCRLESARCFAVEVDNLSGARDHVHLVAGTTADAPVADGRELIDARFFALDDLPAAITPATRRRIERWRVSDQNNASCP